MNEVSEMPKEGQFVAVWIYRGKIWSDIFKWKDGKLYYFDNEHDEFCSHWTEKSHTWGDHQKKPRFFTA